MPTVSLGTPPDDPMVLRDGPRLEGPQVMKRLCRREHDSPWHFSDSGLFRFDLEGGSGHGTCYVASDEIAAIREVLRDDFDPEGPVPRVFFVTRRMWTLKSAPDAWADAPVADLLAERWARHRLTSELWTTDDYARTQPWAVAFWRAGYKAIRVGLRHPLAATRWGLAIFGSKGSPQYEPLFPSVESATFNQRDIDAFTNETGIEVEDAPVAASALNVLG